MKVHDILFYPSSKSKRSHWLFQNTTFIKWGENHQSRVPDRVIMNWGHFNFFSQRKELDSPVVVVHTFDPNTYRAEVGFCDLVAPFSTEWAPGR